MAKKNVGTHSRSFISSFLSWIRLCVFVCELCIDSEQWLNWAIDICIVKQWTAHKYKWKERKMKKKQLWLVNEKNEMKIWFHEWLQHMNNGKEFVLLCMPCTMLEIIIITRHIDVCNREMNLNLSLNLFHMNKLLTRTIAIEAANFECYPRWIAATDFSPLGHTAYKAHTNRSVNFISIVRGILNKRRTTEDVLH